MDAVRREGRVATWLELAVAPEWRRQNCTVRIHALGGKGGGCYALSMDGRWLCTGDARLTVFKGLDSALRFLKVVRIDDFEPGTAPEGGLLTNDRHFCLCVGRDAQLAPCPAGCGMRRLDS